MNEALNIAFCNRPEWDNPLGGDGVQMLKTKEALENNYNVRIDIITSPSQITSGYDIVHIFNYVTTDITRRFFDRALELHIPIASSSIFWDYSYIFSSISKYLFSRKFTHKTGKRLKNLTSLLSRTIGRPRLLTNNLRDEYRFFIRSSNIILPNSFEELQLLSQYVKLDFQNKCHIVVNAFEPKDNLNILPEKSFFEKYSIPRNYILEVGRIETIKNQLNLVKSLMNYPEIPIVLIGRVTEQHYFNKVKALANKRGNVFFIDFIPHDEIASFYHYAALHVLPSLRESPGLVSLEALSNGCPIVVSNHAFTPVNTYFRHQPYIIDPLDINSMHDTIIKAYEERTLETRDLQDFTWENAAHQTWEAYQKMLSTCLSK